MIWDACLAREVAAELRERLVGARARTVRFDRVRRAVHVDLRGGVLTVDLAPDRGEIVVAAGAAEAGDVRGPGGRGRREDGGEAMGLRGAGAAGGRGDRVVPLPAVVDGAEAVHDERVLIVRFRRVRGRKPHPALILELATNRWNAILAEGPDLLVRMRLRMVRGRPHAIGQPWEAPGAKAGEGRGTADVEEWRRLWGESGLRAGLLRGCAWVSPVNVDGLLAAPDAEEGVRRWSTLAGADPSPCVLELPGGPQPYPFAVPGVKARPAPSLIDAMTGLRADALREDGDGDARGGEGAGAAADAWIARILADRARRLGRKRDSLRRQLQGADRADRLREDAALLLASLHRVEQGATKVVLAGFDGAERTFELDPRERPQDRANALFRRAARLERAAAELPKRIHATEEAMAAVADQRARHARGELTREEAAGIAQAHRARASRGRGDGAARTGPTLPYKRYASSGGIEIRVGRGSRRNDDLTFRHSRPNDVWLHARHASGAHVVLRWTRPERPPRTDLEEAAVLAAVHSKARWSGQVPVDWTRRKWVRKPRGAPAGAVVPERVQTLFVAPDPSLADRLTVAD